MRHEGDSLAEVAAGNYRISEEAKTMDCPKGGSFSFTEDSITCSLHGSIGASGGEGEGNIGGTGDSMGETGSQLIPQPSLGIWPESEDFASPWESKTVSPSGIFEWDAGYWVIVKEVSWLSASMAAQGPSSLVASYSAVQITSLTPSYTTESQPVYGQDKMARGSIVEQDGAYYVWYGNDNTEWFDQIGTGHWYQLPST